MIDSSVGLTVAGCGLTILWLASGRALGEIAALVALAGSLVLLYGYANIGIPILGVVVPITELLACVSVPWALTMRFGPAGRQALFLWIALSFVAVARLLVDVPKYGVTALRDALTIAEAGFLFAGYRLGRQRELSIVVLLKWVFLTCAIYFALFPIADVIAAFGPLVGIQRPVPLLGQYSGAGPAAVAGFFLMTLTRPFRTWSYALAALFFVELLLFQSRGDYLAFVLAAALVIGWAGVSGRLARVRRRVAGALVVSALGAIVLSSLSPEGRLGTVSTQFYADHIQTLLGKEGPGSGTIRHRLEMAHQTVSRVTDEPSGIIFGVGFGPDLIGGFTAEQGGDVRKPHNDYLELFARTGVLGLSLFLALLGSISLRVIQGAQQGPQSLSPWLWWVATVQVAYLTVAVFQPLLAFPYGTIPLFMLSGFGLALVDGSLQPSTSRQMPCRRMSGTTPQV